MTRIPKEELERLRALPLRELVDGAGVVLEKRGKDLVGLCPLHKDTDASLVVTESKSAWHCFGCQAGGGVIDWVMATEKLTFRAAVEQLMQRYPPLTTAKEPSARVIELGGALSPSMKDQELLWATVRYYEAVLCESPEALAYLDKRGISRELIETHRLGYCDRTLVSHVEKKHKDELKQRLAGVGVFRENGFEHLVGCLVIPAFTVDGRVGELYGRRILGTGIKRSVRHLYLPGPHAGVFNSQWLEDDRTIILCESFLDGLTFVSAGIRCVTSSFGVEGLTEEIITAICARAPERVVIAYDADEAGELGAEKAARKLGKEGIPCFRARFPKGMDANEYARKVQPADKALSLVVEKAERMHGPVPGLPSPPPATSSTEPAVSSKALHAEPISLPAVDAPVERSPSDKRPTTTKRTTSAREAQCPAAAPAPSDEEEPAPLAAAADDKTEPSSSPTAHIPGELVFEDEHQVTITLADRRYRIRGLYKNLASYEQLKVNVLVQRDEGGPFHVDTFDLYQGKPRAAFVRDAAEELMERQEVVKHDVGRVLGKLEELLEKKRALEEQERVVVPEMSDEEREEALAFLRRPDLLDAVLKDFETLGVVGEETNKLVAYLGATSRKLARPLAVMLQSSSGAGKSAVMDAALLLMPDEERVAYSAMTAQSLFYMADVDLRHKVLAVAEEEGAESATYALKLLQSEGRLSIASTGKDPLTGRHTTQEYAVEGPVAILCTTTKYDDENEELLNRCVLLKADESEAQTKRIHDAQRKSRTLAGLRRRSSRNEVMVLHHNAQRLLRPIDVVNPFDEELTFTTKRTRSRRDNDKYLTLIETIAFVHQHQREVKSEPDGNGGERLYVEVTREDVKRADELLLQMGGRNALYDLPPQSVAFLEKLKGLVAGIAEKEQLDESEVRFSRRQAIEHAGAALTVARKHIKRLCEEELLVVHQGSFGRTYFYELTLDGPKWRALCGRRQRDLAPPDGNLAPPRGDLAPPWLPPGSPLAPPSLPSRNGHHSNDSNTLGVMVPQPAQNTVPRSQNGESKPARVKNGAGHGS